MVWPRGREGASGRWAPGQTLPGDNFAPEGVTMKTPILGLDADVKGPERGPWKIRVRTRHGERTLTARLGEGAARLDEKYLALVPLIVAEDFVTRPPGRSNIDVTREQAEMAVRVGMGRGPRRVGRLGILV